MTNPWLGVEAVSQWLSNTVRHRPWAISIEITHNCTANCQHCDKGERIDDEKLASPEEYLRIYKQLRPIVIQISGGEPLLRKDLLDIIRILKKPGHLPYLVLVTNASLLTVEKYAALKRAGIDQFSISLDFPDSRHDENRRIPGLYAHLDDIIPRITRNGNGDINVLTAVTRLNYPYLLDNLRVAERWRTRMNLSIYTAGRTGNRDLLISSPQDLEMFRTVVDKLIEEKRKGACIFASEAVLNRYYRFFERGANANGCKAGIRCLVVNPDGRLCPCAMKPETAYGSLRELQEHFSRTNHCSDCYISMRAHTEKSLGEMARDVWVSRMGR